LVTAFNCPIYEEIFTNICPLFHSPDSVLVLIIHRIYVLEGHNITVRYIHILNAATSFDYLLKAFPNLSGCPTLQFDTVTKETRKVAGMAKESAPFQRS